MAHNSIVSLARAISLAFVIAICASAGARAADEDAEKAAEKAVATFKVLCLDTAGDTARVDAAATGLNWRKLTAAEAGEIDASVLQPRLPVRKAAGWAGELDGMKLWVYATDRDYTREGGEPGVVHSCDVLAPVLDRSTVKEQIVAICPGNLTWDFTKRGMGDTLTVEKFENGVRISCDCQGARGGLLRIPSYNGDAPYAVLGYGAFPQSPKKP